MAVGSRMHHATRWSVLLTVALATLIVVLTLTPPVQTGMPAGSDKAYHFLAFTALALPLAVVRPRWSGWLFVLFAVFGAAIEVIQPYVGRSRELADLLSDMMGIAFGMVVGALARLVIQRVRDRRKPFVGEPQSGMGTRTRDE